MLTLLRGLPGSGKTYYANQLVAQNPNLVHAEADQYYVRDDGVYEFRKELIKEAHDWCYLKTKVAMDAGKDVVVANVFAEVWQLKRYLELAKNLDVPAMVLLVEGNFGSEHNVPESTIKHMKRIWEPFATNWRD